MKAVKRFWDGLPAPIRTLIICLSIWKAFTALKAMYAKYQLNQELKKDSSLYDTGTGPVVTSPFNVGEWVKSMWYECYSGFFGEDENKIMALITSVPLAYRKACNDSYARYLVDNKKNHHKYMPFIGLPWGVYYGKSLQEDMLELLSSSQYNTISYFFKSL